MITLKNRQKSIENHLRQTLNIPSRFMNKPRKALLNLIIRQERHITRMSNGQNLPILQEAGPRLKKTSENVEFKIRD